MCARSFLRCQRNALCDMQYLSYMNIFNSEDLILKSTFDI